MVMLVAGLLLLWLSSYLLRGFVKANPAVLSRRLRQAGGWLALGFAVFAIMRGELNLAFGAGLFGFWLLGTQPGWATNLAGRSAPRWGARPQRRRVSRVRTLSLEMMLDQASGQIAGQCLAGPMAGRSLEALSQTESVALYRWCELSDPQGARLLETYLDRRFADWRIAGHPRDDARGNGGSARHEKTAGMSEREAHELLGLQQGATRNQITQAHRRLMKKFHPDHGGSNAIAARVNEAKDVLMRRHP